MKQHRPHRWENMPEPDMGRPRRWMMHDMGDVVVVRQYAILGPGEHLDEYPPTWELTRVEWEQKHADYGLSIDGNPLE